MSAPTIPAENTQAVTTTGGTQPFTTQWWDFFDSLLTYVQTIGGIPTIPTDTWYVSASGSDSNTGQSAGSPFLTIQHAVDVVLGYDLDGTSLVTINVGAGTFAGWSAIGPARGWTGDQQTGAPLGACAILVKGAGSGSTNINPMATQASLCIGCSGGLYMGIEGMNINVPGASNVGAGLNINTSAVFSLDGDIIFTGGGDGTGTAIFADANGFVFNGGTVTTKGTLSGYYASTNTANYESIGGNVVISGTIANFVNLEVLSNMHGETVSKSGGTTTGAAYLVDGNSFLSLPSTLTGVWTDLGVLSNGGRTEGACNTPTVVATTGLGSGSAAIAAGSNAYATTVVLSPAGSPSNAGTVEVSLSEVLTANTDSFAPYVVTAAPGTGTWSAVTAWISAITQNATTAQITISWYNNGVDLSAGSTYKLNLIGQT